MTALGACDYSIKPSSGPYKYKYGPDADKQHTDSGNWGPELRSNARLEVTVLDS
jgi:hypothetical protein